jgi:hypothetical protein
MEYKIQLKKVLFTKENDVMKSRRISLKLNTLLLWLGRHVVYDHYFKSEWFRGEETDTEYFFFFKLEKDKKKAELFLDEILENGIPRMRV